MNKIVGFDIGGTKTAVVIGKPDGSICSRAQFPTDPQKGFDDFLRRAREALEPLRHEWEEVTCASIAVGGPVDEDAGRLHAPPHLPGWQGTPLRDALAELAGVPAFLLHDARAGAFAEYHFGMGTKMPGISSLAFLTFATGFGCGAILDGRLADIPGEVGHWRVAEEGPEIFGKRGSLEGLASGTGIAAQARVEDSLPDDISVPELAEKARRGDPFARQIFDLAAVQVGRQCARLIDFLGLEAIALGTLAVQCGDLVMDRIREVAREEALPHLAERCTIAPAALGPAVGDVSSLAAAILRAPAHMLGRAPSVRHQLASAGWSFAVVGRDAEFVESLDRAARAVVKALQRGNKILTCGNGGSATDAAHLAEELVGRYRGDRVSVPAISLSADGSVLTCIANDYGFDEIFARQVDGLGKKGDVLVCFTTSGNSENVNRAIARAKERGVLTVAVTGKSGGAARTLADICVHVPLKATERIQEVHTLALHAICELVEMEFAPAQ